MNLELGATKRKAKSPKEKFDADKLAWHEHLLGDERLTSSDTRVAGILLHLFNFDRGGTAWASIATYAVRTTLSEKTVRAAIQNLERHGWIAVNKGRRGYNGTNRIEPVFGKRIEPISGRDARQDAVKNVSPPLTQTLTQTADTAGEIGEVEQVAEWGRERRNAGNSAPVPHQYGTSSEPVPHQFPTARDAVKNDQRCGKKGSGDAVKNDPQFLYDSCSSPVGAHDLEEEKEVDKEGLRQLFQNFGPDPQSEPSVLSLEECARVMLLNDFDPSELPAEISDADREKMEPVSFEVEDGRYNRSTPKRLKLVALAMIQERRQL